MNIDKEINDLVEILDDALNNASEEFSMNFTERQYNDWLSDGRTLEDFDIVENDIINEALRRIVDRILNSKIYK